MMRTLLCGALILLALSCKNSDKDSQLKPDSVASEYADWYTLKAPVDKEIQGVWGQWEKTLLISTGDAIFRSTDQGKNWQQVHQQQNGMFGIVNYQDTLFTMTGLLNYQFLKNPDNYSVDDGKTWQRYTNRNPVFNVTFGGPIPECSVNPVTTSTGVAYRINEVFRDGPSAKTGPFETPGILTSDGRRIDLPQLHQLRGLYLDSQQRLYIAATDAVCGRGRSYGEAFSFCNSKNGRGVVYISKQPLP